MIQCIYIELIYFGPDEQIIPSDIEWIVNRAAVRGYPIPGRYYI